MSETIAITGKSVKLFKGHYTSGHGATGRRRAPDGGVEGGAVAQRGARPSASPVLHAIRGQPGRRLGLSEASERPNGGQRSRQR
ncbi:MAG: hypothetical protein ACREYE_32600 [Gammaproteobacteria bacterium]